MSGTGWLTVNLRRSNEGKRLCFWKWRVFFEVWVKVFGSHFREAHYISAFSLQDKRKISNTWSHLWFETADKPFSFQGSLSEDTTADSKKAQETSFSWEKGSLHNSHWFGYRMHPQGDERKQRLFPRSLLPLSFSVLKCASVSKYFTPSALNNMGALHWRGSSI